MFTKTTLIAVAATLACAAQNVSTPGAEAGQYHVYSCRTPAGEGAPADGWSPTTVGTFTFAENTCSQPDGGLLAALGIAARTANASSASWMFSPPAGASITNAVLWRAGDADGGAAVNATYEFWLAGPTETEIFEECLYALGCTSGLGDANVPLAPGNRVEVPVANRGARLIAEAACGGVSTFKCKEGQGDTHNYAAAVYLYAADITLEQAAGPTAGAVGGELASAPTVSGTSDLAFQASDPGAGVYQALVSVDGQLTEIVALDQNGGRCRDVGETMDGLPAFLYRQPCLASLSADVALDTTRLANGSHHLVVSVTDAAGNSATVLDRDIVVANAGAPSTASLGAGASGGAPATGAGTGPANGANASSQASLAVAWKGTRGTRLATAFGRTEIAQGQLLAPGGVPISGAQVEVLATPSYAGARTAASSNVRTGSDGRFTLRVAPGASSRTVVFAYRSHLGDPQPAAARSLSLVVRAGLTLTISPRTASVGSHIRFTGRLLGGPVPAVGKLLVLEARSGGGSWIKFNVVRSDRAGRYRASYRFRFPGPVRYQFRVVSEAEGDYPFATGESNTVVVREG